jgi:hypothetical protein
MKPLRSISRHSFTETRSAKDTPHVAGRAIKDLCVCEEIAVKPSHCGP